MRGRGTEGGRSGEEEECVEVEDDGREGTGLGGGGGGGVFRNILNRML